MKERSFWQWFAEEGLNQLMPALSKNTDLEMSPVDKKLTEVAVETFHVPDNQLSAPTHRPNEDEFMRRSRLMLSEFANIGFEYRPLNSLRGLLIAWKGRRQFCLPIGATIDQETDIVLHMLGHVALGHINERILTVRLESDEGEPKQDLQEEQEANTWAQELRWNHRILRKGLV